MSGKKARIKDIADIAGVSIGTVDRVLHDRGEVAERTRQRVLEIARELNYTPNLIAQVLKSRRKFHIVSLLPESDFDNTFWNKHPQGMVKAIDELIPFPVNLSQITFDMTNENDFQEKTRTVLKIRPDGVLFAPIFKAESITFCASLEKEHIPFIFVDGFIEKTGFLAYVGEDVFRSGRVAGQLTDLITPENKDILIVNIAKNLQNIHHLSNRTNGFLSYFPDSGKNRGNKITLNIPDTTFEKIKSDLSKAFGKYPGISSIFITGSKSYKIAEYLDDAGIKSVNLIGYDLLDKNVEYLRSGIIKFLIGQRPEEQTYRGIKKLFEFLSLNKVPEKMEYLPVDIVTSENVNLFI